MLLARYLRTSAQLSFHMLLVLALVFPIILGAAKAVLFGYCVAAVLFLQVIGDRKSLALHRITFLFFGSLVLVNGFFVIWGMWNGAPIEGSLEAVNVYVFFPLVYLVIVAITPAVISPEKMIRILLLVSVLICLLTIVQAFRVFSLGILPGYSLLYGLYPGLENDYVNFAFTGEDGFLPRAAERLAFLGPFAVALFAVGSKVGISNRLVWANFLLVLIAVTLTGRRAFAAIIVLSILALFLGRFVVLRKRILQGLAVFAFLGLVGVAIHKAVGEADTMTASRIETMSSSVASDLGSLSFSIRATQIRYILDEADENPVLGVGFGNKIAGHVRDPQHPWRFELTYVALLFQTGAIGVALYALIGLQLARMAAEAWRQCGEIVLPFVFGMVGGLIAVATNPYLNYGTGQWLIFLPVAIFNGILIQAQMGTGFTSLLPAVGGRRVTPDA